MTDLQIFDNPEFGSVRVMMIDGEPWFVGKDVATALGYVDTFGALKKHVDDEDKLVCQIENAGSRMKFCRQSEKPALTLALIFNKSSIRIFFAALQTRLKLATKKSPNFNRKPTIATESFRATRLLQFQSSRKTTDLAQWL